MGRTSNLFIPVSSVTQSLSHLPLAPPPEAVRPSPANNLIKISSDPVSLAKLSSLAELDLQTPYPKLHLLSLNAVFLY